METAAPERVAELVNNLIADELDAEDKLNDEVREKLEEYSDYMRREGISYQDMFRKAKNALIQQKKIVRASGRDTGDQMKLSRDKITDISHKLIALMRKSRDIRFKKDQNDARLEIVKAFTEILQLEEKIGPRRERQGPQHEEGYPRRQRRVGYPAKALLRGKNLKGTASTPSK